MYAAVVAPGGDLIAGANKRKVAANLFVRRICIRALCQRTTSVICHRLSKWSQFPKGFGGISLIHARVFSDSEHTCFVQMEVRIWQRAVHDFTPYQASQQLETASWFHFNRFQYLYFVSISVFCQGGIGVFCLIDLSDIIRGSSPHANLSPHLPPSWRLCKTINSLPRDDNHLLARHHHHHHHCIDNLPLWCCNSNNPKNLFWILLLVDWTLHKSKLKLSAVFI